MKLIKQILYFSFFSISLFGWAQETDSISTYQLEDVVVSAPRLPRSVEDLPFSITHLDSILIQSERQNLSIKEHLRMVPGVYIQNAYNFTQDARVSIRGFGATSPFGIRGIKLIVDGIPETTPDGTGQLDNLNLDLIGDIRVIRGSASSLYGNASGGAILIQSKFDKDYLVSKTMIGSYGFYSQSISGGTKLGRSIITGHVRLFGSDGFRQHNQFKQLNSRFGLKHQFNDRLKATFLLEYVNSPEAQDAGGLTLEETQMDFQMARDRNITFDAGEEITQWKAGTGLEWQWTQNKTLNTYAFYNQRTFDGRLPFQGSGTISLKRDYFGLGNSLDIRANQHKIKIGYDFLSQTDDRQRFDNMEGIGGAQTLNQEESFLNLGWYLLDYIEIDRWYFSAGLRQDINWLEAKDEFLDDGDDSGDINIVNWSYHAGVTRMFSPSFQLFANHATNFETPTLNQLSNRPDNSGGFEDLKSATTSSFETGLKWNRNEYGIELTGFFTKTKNELVPYELAEFPERTFFRNAGSTLRRGLEATLNYVTSKWSIYTSYTFSNFEYDEYIDNGENLSGFNLPGIPKHHATLTFVSTPLENLEISIPFDYVGNLWADDQNEVAIEDYLEVNFSARYQINLTKLAITPSVGIRNLTNRRYFDNIRINAFGGRHYEPAPERNFYFGLKISL